MTPITLLLAITAAAFCAIGASFGYVLGHRHGGRHETERRDYEIRVMHDLYAYDPHGDD